MTARDRTVVIVVAVLAALASAWFFVISPKRSQASKLGSQISSVQSQLDTARSELAQNEAAKSAFSTSYATLVRLGEAVPVDDNVPSLIYQLQGAAGDAKVDFRSLQLTSNTSGSTPVPGSPSAAQAQTAALPPGATVGPAGFPTEQFTFIFRGNFFHLADFFHRLQKFVVATNSRVLVSGRLMTLNAISLAPGSGGFPQITASIGATTYLVPPSQGLVNGATVAGPGASTSQPVSTSSSSTPTPAAAVGAPTAP